jgi:hypothetical protein
LFCKWIICSYNVDFILSCASSTNNSLKLISSTCSSVWLTTYLFSFGGPVFPTWLLNKNEKKLTRSFNFTFCYIDDVLSLNNTRFGDFVDRIYPIELEIKDNTDTGLLHILTYTSKLKVRAVKNETLRHKRWFQFSHCELSIYV